jgi:hypothetical protein
VSWLGKDGKTRKLAFHHSDFIAAMIAGAHATIFVDLVGQVFTLRKIEAQLGEKLRAAGKQANAANLMLASF